MSTSKKNLHVLSREQAFGAVKAAIAQMYLDGVISEPKFLNTVKDLEKQENMLQTVATNRRFKSNSEKE